MKYKVVFRGKVDRTVDQKMILENLSDLFDQTTEEVYQRFFAKGGQSIVLITGLSEGDAIEYQTALADAGLIADIDLDVDDLMPELSMLEVTRTQTIASQSKPSATDHSPTHTERKLAAKDYLKAPEELTLMRHTDDVSELESNRVEKMKRIAKTRANPNHNIEIDDRDIAPTPPLLHSGVRIGRLYFLYRITLAFAILFGCLNILPLYLYDALGSASFIISFFFIFFAITFMLMIVSQRFCDIDNLSIGKMAFVTILIFTLIFSLFVQNYYVLKDAQVQFAELFVREHSMSEQYFGLKAELKEYLAQTNQRHFLQQIDAIIKWVVYAGMIIGAILLFSMPGIEGNNQFGAPPPSPNLISLLMFVVSLFAFLYCVAYPFSSKAHKYQHRLYQTELYEYLGVLKPLPNEFNRAYKAYLEKNSTKAQ